MTAYSQEELDAGLRTGDTVADAWEQKIVAGKGKEIDFAADLGLDEEKLAKWLSKPGKALQDAQKEAAETAELPAEGEQPDFEKGFSHKYTED